MRTLSQKMKITTERFVKRTPTIVKALTRDAVSFFKGEVFDRSGVDVQPNGQRWKKRKGKQETRRLLVKTGKMRRSIVGNAKGNFGVVQTNVPYAHYHQTGTKDMPQRKFMGESDKLNKMAKRAIDRELERAFRSV